MAPAAVIGCLPGPGSKNGRNKRATSIRPAGEGAEIPIQAQNSSTNGALCHGQS